MTHAARYPRPVPEMLEVETYRQLAEEALGRTVASLSCPDAWYLKGAATGPALRRALVGHPVIGTRRIGKLLMLDVDTGAVVGVRFGMTGSLLVDGTDVVIFFYGCNHGPRCPSITFQSDFDSSHGVTAEDVNTWNADKRFIKGWLNTDKVLYGEMDVDVSHGFSTENLAEYVDTWAAFLPEFKQKFGY